VQQADPSLSSPSQNMSLHLLGGGVTGVFFHMGVLAALDDHLSIKMTKMGSYVGVSAGSLVATMCAVGIEPQACVEAVMKDDRSFFYIKRKNIYRFSIFDWTAEILKFIWTFFYIIYLKINRVPDAPSFFWGLKDAFPDGLFSMRYYEDWIKSFLQRQKVPKFFSEVKAPLYIPSFDLDSCERIVFGSEGHDHIPIYKAISASSSIPLFFKPVEIENRHYVDGGLGRMAHLDLAPQEGTKVIFLINPMVPIQNDMSKVKIRTVFEDKGRIRDKGLTYVYDQTMRMELSLRVSAAIDHFKHRRPDVDVILIEPDQDDPTMFLFNPMEFESRKQVVEHAYDLTRRKLRENKEAWQKILDKNSVTLTGV
jgi:predicted acylesterase/phospholipase RssA